MTKLDRCYNVADLREAARQRLPRGVFEYVDRGSEDERALNRNLRAYGEINLLNRSLANMTKISLETMVLGAPSAMPLAIAPTGSAGICWYEGELEVAKAAAKAGIPFALSTPSNTAMEKIAKEAGGRHWFQLYMWPEKELSDELVGRAASAGFEGLIWTLDHGDGANREYNRRNGFNTPYKLSTKSVIDALLHPRWLAGVLGRYVMTTGMPRHVNYPAKYREKITGAASTRMSHALNVGWDDVERLRSNWRGSFILKGIQRVEEAEEAARRGVDAIVISNHGGRNMDSAPCPIDLLPEIASAVKGKTTIIVDSGVRRGSDIVKAMALGADLVLVGRAPLYGVSFAGQAGADKAISILATEMRKTMAYIGRQRVADIDESDIWQRGLRRERVAL